MKKLTLILTFLLLWTVVCGLSTAQADIPHLISYQGRLTNTSGGAVPNNTYSVTFRIYTSEAGGADIWSETDSVTTREGIFEVLLGGRTALDLPFDTQYYLGIQVGSDPEMTPRQKLASVGYAYMAENAEKIKVSSTDATTGYLDAKVAKSIVVSSNKLELSGDNVAPGNSKYYGTNLSGSKGWFGFPLGITGVQAFTSPGTWTKPANVSKVYVQVWGAGGGGFESSGGGGGGGAYAAGIVTVTGDVAVTVGTGGSNRQAGGSSSFGTSVVAGGGGAGDNPGGSAGGMASAGDIQISGQAGGGAPHGQGGGSPFGGAGGASNSVNVQFGGAPGGGGSGGPKDGGGANGADGLVIVYW